jgi:hypothetical protein
MVSSPQRPVVGKRSLPTFYQGEDLLSSDIYLGIGCVVNDPKPTSLFVLVLVLPMVTGQIRGNDQVKEEVEGVDPESSSPKRLDEVDIPVTAAAVVIEEPTDTEVLASRVAKRMSKVVSRRVKWSNSHWPPARLKMPCARVAESPLRTHSIQVVAARSSAPGHQAITSVLPSSVITR